jgi:hypothetical protein
VAELRGPLRERGGGVRVGVLHEQRESTGGVGDAAGGSVAVQGFGAREVVCAVQRAGKVEHRVGVAVPGGLAQKAGGCLVVAGPAAGPRQFAQRAAVAERRGAFGQPGGAVGVPEPVRRDGGLGEN